ncbi:1-hydroxycarotenoid 3,4-desaturase CrtD [Arcticibacter sp. MXS-1]|uniref:1-hydroxycarotenoid 3,4-desaturase CrtD n=1 Tax=Arcticibacter sp. MXS-1 TaxID=3341726 RepID=UPI0035A95BA8
MEGRPQIRKAIVIGAGIGGIAASVRLAVKGYAVDVFESNAYPGGKLSEFGNQGFRFDAGPSLFTMPQYVDELFELAGKDPRDYFNYQKLDMICRYFYEDGTRISAWADPLAFANEIASRTTDSAESVRRFMQKSEEIYRITHHVFLERSLHKLNTYLRADTLRSVLEFPKIDPFRTMNGAVEDFFSDSKTRRFFNRYATYNGSDPYRAPATLNVIPHLEQHYGAWFPEGGMFAITRSLVQLAEEMGVRFHYNTPVKQVLLGGNQVKGVQTEEGDFFAEVVVSNMDVWFVYQKLLKGIPPPKRTLRQERSSSALIFYWGIGRTFDELDLHNIFFSEDYREEFRYIWDQQSICADPTVYVNISSKYEKSDAPEGCENWFVMINVPANKGQDWDRLIQEAREHIIQKLSRNLGTDIGALIRTENILDPRSIESLTSSYQGALYGTSSNSRFAAFLRHPNFSGAVKGLFFTGGSVHPGGGIPLALLSARIAVENVG